MLCLHVSQIYSIMNLLSKRWINFKKGMVIKMKISTQDRQSIFGNAEYIKATENAPSFSYTDPLPFFRKEILIDKPFEKADITVQAPGFAKFYINGNHITEDIFISATSDYDKILWYNTYDVTPLLQQGKNILGVIAGNGFFNESFQTGWDFDIALWRDAPQFILCLRVDGEIASVSDESWKCSREKSHIIFSHLRSGEYVDMRKYDPAWLRPNYDDGDWQSVVLRSRPITAVFRPAACQPVRECERIAPISIKKTTDGAFIADFGKTISGYAEISLCEPCGTEVLFYYAEELYPDGIPKHNDMNKKNYYRYTPFQHNRLITSGKTDTFKPSFFYGGFRYLRIEGLTKAPEQLFAIFTHQTVERRASFDCGNDVLNYIYNAGIQSTYSNLFWCLTDCPTREKLGWTNDAQASLEQTLINFNIVPLLEKWYEDIKISMFADGSLHGTVPSPDWPWGHACGPVCDCLLYEMPYRVYLYTGEIDMLNEGIPFFERYIAFLEKKIAENHEFILGDWMSSPKLKAMIAKMYLLKAYDITAFAHKITGRNSSRWEKKATDWRDTLCAQYVNPNGESAISMQTAIAMLLAFRIGKDRSALIKQLLNIIERDSFQLRAGMVGFQYIYHVLSDIGRGDLAYRLLTETAPGYKTWYDYGETTLWEEWNGENRGSHNHHMYSGVISWFFRSLLGISPLETSPAFEKIELNPVFIESLKYVNGSMETVRGTIKASWEFRDGQFIYSVTIPDGISAFFQGEKLKIGKNIFHIHPETDKNLKLLT